MAKAQVRPYINNANTMLKLLSIGAFYHDHFPEGKNNSHGASCFYSGDIGWEQDKNRHVWKRLQLMTSSGLCKLVDWWKKM